MSNSCKTSKDSSQRLKCCLSYYCMSMQSKVSVCVLCRMDGYLVQIPGQEGNFFTKKYLQPTSPPICKTGTWSCTGEQSALAVSHYSLMVLVGLQGAHTGSERHSQYSCELLARAPGVCIAPAHGTCLVHRCPGLTRNA